MEDLLKGQVELKIHTDFSHPGHAIMGYKVVTTTITQVVELYTSSKTNTVVIDPHESTVETKQEITKLVCGHCQAMLALQDGR